MRFIRSFTLFCCLFPLVAQASHRLISLKPNITEIIFDLGAGDQLIGVTSYCDRPAEATKIAKVADYIHLDSEKIMWLKPTLVLGSTENSVEREFRFLTKQGIHIEFLSFGRLNQMFDSITKMGDFLNTQEKAHEILNHIQSTLQELKDQVPSNPLTQKVVVMVGLKPFVVVGNDNLIDDLMKDLNIGNLYRGGKSRYPTINIEDLILKSPEVIIDLSMGDEEKTKSEHWAQLHDLQSIPAIKNKRYYVLDVRDFHPAPSLLNGARALVELFKGIK
ncbi:MAG: hypothetical protein ACD_73C00688G0001 [uncultured bacterium]|nr:MAG: hypothetical protein ACD_73C00688G0001 [uncultured bacterium]